MDKYLYNLCTSEYNNFFNYTHVQGVGYGYKEINNMPTNIPCFKVMVDTKLSPSQLSSNDLIPKYHKGYVTDVIEVGTFNSLGFTSKVRPILGGISIGVLNTPYVGTLGCEVFGNTTTLNTIYLLSNNHVISNENSVLKGTKLLQPGQGDGGNPSTDIVSTLIKSIPIQFTTPITTPNNIVDCALGLITIPSIITNSIISIGSIGGIAPPMLNLPVQKSGRTTGYTTGSITAINASVNVSYNTGTAFFTNQIVTTAMSSPGDSGSIILDMNNRIIGLLFAGSASYTIANDITNVLTFLGINI